MKGLVKTGKKERGFSMVELMVVIAVLALLASLAIPAVNNWLPNYRLKRAARDLYSNLQLAKMTAIRNNADCAVVFDPAVNPGRYFICTDDGADGVWNGPPAMGGDDTALKTVELTAYQSGVDYGWGNAAVAIAGAFDNGITFASAGINDAAVFNQRGLLQTTTGYVYLQNTEGTSYGIGALTSGVMRLQKWHESSANWE